MLKIAKINSKYWLFLISLLLINCDFTTAEQNFKTSNKYADSKEFTRAITELDKAIKKKKKYRPALFNRAIYKTEIKDISGAIEDYRNILSFTNCTECGYRLSIIFNNDKQYKRAIKLLNATLKTKGIVKHGNIFNPNLQFFNDDSDSDYNVSEEDVYFERGLAYLKAKQFKKAINDFKKTNEFDFYKNEGYYNIGEAYLGLKDTLKACENYKQSEKLKNKGAKKRMLEICNEDID